jgi:hypothetical protein
VLSGRLRAASARRAGKPLAHAIPAVAAQQVAPPRLSDRHSAGSDCHLHHLASGGHSFARSSAAITCRRAWPAEPCVKALHINVSAGAWRRPLICSRRQSSATLVGSRSVFALPILPCPFGLTSTLPHAARPPWTGSFFLSYAGRIKDAKLMTFVPFLARAPRWAPIAGQCCCAGRQSADDERRIVFRASCSRPKLAMKRSTLGLAG